MGGCCVSRQKNVVWRSDKRLQSKTIGSTESHKRLAIVLLKYRSLKERLVLKNN